MGADSECDQRRGDQGLKFVLENKRNSDADQHSDTDTERNGRPVPREIEFDIDHCHPIRNTGCQQSDQSGDQKLNLLIFDRRRLFIPFSVVKPSERISKEEKTD